MSDLLGKISSYNIFNYLFAGIVFVTLADIFTSFSFIQNDTLIAIGFYYLIGLVLSRIGSFMVEPLLKAMSFVRFATYSDYISASKVDQQIKDLSEVNNMYRTLIATFFGLILTKIYDILQPTFYTSNLFEVFGLLSGLLIVFLFAYKKQTSYIVRRININIKNNE